MRPTSVLATLTGRDRPGVPAAFFAALAAHDVDVRDVELVVIQDRLVLTVEFDLRGDPGALRSSAITSARALGMDCEVTIAADGATTRFRKVTDPRSQVLVIGHPLRPGALSHIAQRIADCGGNIESTLQVSTAPVWSIEMTVAGHRQDELRRSLVQAAEDTGVDIAVEPAALRRRAKRLVLLDLDATLLREHSLDLLSQHIGATAAVGAPRETDDTSREQSLRARVDLLAGVAATEVEWARDHQQLAAGSAEFVRALRRLGYAVGAVSTGFSMVVDRLVDELELDFALSNELEVQDGRLTGHLVGPVMDRAAKTHALRTFAHQARVPMSQTVAVGAGRQDADMLTAAGLGIAFNALAADRAAADTSLQVPYLDTVLFVLGTSLGENDASAV
jgi:phosphoserine phosphatase